MHTYISLLRGINVSGKNKIKMAELKSLYESLNFKSVSTYIQSGNVVFQNSETSLEIQQTIEAAIEQYFGFHVPVLILNKEQLETSVIELPFTGIDIDTQASKIILFYLSEPSSTNSYEMLKPFLSNAEQLVIAKEVIYLYCPSGLGKSKVTNKLIETKLQLTSTARNFRTANKLLSIASL